VTRFNAARDEEYDEVVDEAERFREEIAREPRKGKFTFAELEDEESNLERLRQYLAQVQARDVLRRQGKPEPSPKSRHVLMSWKPSPKKFMTGRKAEAETRTDAP
jgi:ChrB-like protein